MALTQTAYFLRVTICMCLCSWTSCINAELLSCSLENIPTCVYKGFYIYGYSSHMHSLFQCQSVKVTNTCVRSLAGVAEKLHTTLTRLCAFQKGIWLWSIAYKLVLCCSQLCGDTILHWYSQGRASHICMVISNWYHRDVVQWKRFDWLRLDSCDFTLMITVFLRTH